MSLKNEVAALMASDGEYEKKISLLKKAVVSVTKQKQELETQLGELQEEVRRTRQELSGSREENLKLHRRVTTLEGELDQERKKATPFGQNFMKGLSSLVAGGDDGGASGGSTGQVAGRGKGRNGPAQQPLSLSPEDVESIVKENEKLLMQAFSVTTKYDELKAKMKEAREKARADQETAERKIEEQRGLLDTTTHACDELNALCTKQRSLVSFCQRFFSLHASVAEDPPSVTFAIGPAKMGGGGAPRETNADDDALTTTTLDSTIGHAEATLDAVSVLLTALREKLPRAQRATVGDLRLFSDRLATLYEAHQMEKMAIAYRLKEIRHMMGERAEETDAQVACEALYEQGSEAVAGFLRWLRLMRSHIPLLVDSCVASLPAAGETYKLLSCTTATAAAATDDAVVTRDTTQSATQASEAEFEQKEAFVEEVVALFNTFLSNIEGSLEALQMLLGASKAPLVASLLATTAQEASDVGVRMWLVALLQFWWEGGQAAPALRSSANCLSALVANTAQACHSDHARDTLVYLSNRIKAFGEEVTARRGTRAGRAKRRSRVSCLAEPTTAQRHAPHQSESGLLSGSPAAMPGEVTLPANQEELIHALAAADRAAVTYWTQMNATMLELAEKEDLLEESREALQVARAQLAESNAEAEAARRAFQEKIRLLSDQLVQYTARGASRDGP